MNLKMENVIALKLTKLYFELLEVDFESYFGVEKGVRMYAETSILLDNDFGRLKNYCLKRSLLNYCFVAGVTLP